MMVSRTISCFEPVAVVVAAAALILVGEDVEFIHIIWKNEIWR